MERKYYHDIDYKPFLFFAVFGVEQDNLQVSTEKHHVDEIPEGLDLRCINRENNNDYIENFFQGAIGDIMKEKNKGLYDKCHAQDKCVIIQGEVEKDSTLDYMRNVIGVIEALVENGATGILDLLTFSLISPEEWTKRFFEKEVNALNHVLILISEDNGSYWLHTRGMSEFGRPDISMENVTEDKLEEYKRIVDQIIYFGGEGAVLKETVKIHTAPNESYMVNAEFVNDFQNDDFNNAYYKISVIEKIVE